MAKFVIFWPTLSRNEGGYVSQKEAEAKNDSGGETYEGIARAKHPDWPGFVLIDSYKAQATFPAILSRDHTLQQMVLTFYKGQFWDVLQADNIDNQSIANMLADWGVNAGPSIPAKHIQIILGVDEDGIIGPGTIAALNKAISVTGPELMEELKAARIEFYKEVVEAHPNQAGELDGWIARTNRFVYA